MREENSFREAKSEYSGHNAQGNYRKGVMASNELLRLRAFARGDPVQKQDPAVGVNYRTSESRALVEASARIGAQAVEAVRSCRETVKHARELLDRLKASRATSVPA